MPPGLFLKSAGLTHLATYKDMEIWNPYQLELDPKFIGNFAGVK